MMNYSLFKKNMSIILCAAMLITGSVNAFAAEAIEEEPEMIEATAENEITESEIAESEISVGDSEDSENKADYLPLFVPRAGDFYVRFFDASKGLPDGIYNETLKCYCGGFDSVFSMVDLVENCTLVVKDNYGTMHIDGDMLELLSAAYDMDVAEYLKKDGTSKTVTVQLQLLGDEWLQMGNVSLSYNHYMDQISLSCECFPVGSPETWINVNIGAGNSKDMDDKRDYASSLMITDFRDEKPGEYKITMCDMESGEVLWSESASSELFADYESWTIPYSFHKSITDESKPVYFIIEDNTATAYACFVKADFSTPGPGPGPVVKNPRFEKTSVDIFNGKAAKLKILDTKLDKRTTLKAKNWASSDTDVATVKNGKVTPKKTGTVAISVDLYKGTELYKNLSCTVNVEKATVSSNKATLTMGADEPQSLTLKLNDLFPGTEKEEWTSLKKTVATVDETGAVTPLKAGKVKFKTKRDGKTFYVTATIYNPEIVTPRRNRIEGSDALSLKLNKGLTLKVKGGYKPVYTSMNPEIVSVSTRGKVKGLAAGTALIKIETVGKTMYQEIVVE